MDRFYTKRRIARCGAKIYNHGKGKKLQVYTYTASERIEVKVPVGQVWSGLPTVFLPGLSSFARLDVVICKIFIYISTLFHHNI